MRSKKRLEPGVAPISTTIYQDPNIRMNFEEGTCCLRQKRPRTVTRNKHQEPNRTSGGSDLVSFSLFCLG